MWSACIEQLAAGKVFTEMDLAEVAGAGCAGGPLLGSTILASPQRGLHRQLQYSSLACCAAESPTSSSAWNEEVQKEGDALDQVGSS